MQFDTNGILISLYIVKVDTNPIYANMDIHETILFIYTSTHTYTDTCTNIQRHINKIAYTHITSLPILLQYTTKVITETNKSQSKQWTMMMMLMLMMMMMMMTLITILTCRFLGLQVAQGHELSVLAVGPQALTVPPTLVQLVPAPGRQGNDTNTQQERPSSHHQT